MKDKHAEKATRLFKALGLLHYLKTPRVKDIKSYHHVFPFPLELEGFPISFLDSFNESSSLNDLSFPERVTLPIAEKSTTELKTLFDLPLKRLSQNFDLYLGLFLFKGHYKRAPIHHPLLSVKVRPNLSFVKEDSVVLSLENQSFSFEQELLSPLEWPSKASLDNIVQSFLGTYEESKDIILSSFSEFATDLDTQNLSFSPLLFTRKKSHHKFTKFISGICHEVQKTTSIPREFLKFLKNKDICSNPLEESENPNTLEDYLLPLFPLPSNEEQQEALKLLHDQDALIITGLPGTGKTQTAVNLACHFLSHGEKVLVTSESKTGLSSFLDKMPKELDPLLFQDISPIDSDKSHPYEDLESSLFSILKKNQNTSIDSLEERIQSLTVSLKKCREQIKKTWSNLVYSRESENTIHHNKFGVYKGTLSQIARQLLEERPKFEWFEDEPGPLTPLPFVDQENLLKIWDFYIHYSLEDEKKLEREVPKLPFLSASEFSDYIEKEKNINEKYQKILPHKKGDLYFQLLEFNSGTLKQTTRQFKELEKLISEIQEEKDSWMTLALEDILGQNESQWTSILEVTRNSLTYLKSFDIKELSLDLKGLNNNSISILLEEAEKLLNREEEPHHQKFWPFKKKNPIKSHRLFKKITISGEKCHTKHQIQKAVQALKIKQSIEETVSVWKGIGIDITLPPLQLLNILEFYIKILDKCFSIKNKFKELEKNIPIFKNENWSRSQILQRSIHNTELVIFEKMLELIQSKLQKHCEEIKDKINSNTHPLVEDLVRFLEERDAKAYQSHLELIFQLQKEKKYFYKIKELAQEIKLHCPLLYNDMKTRTFSFAKRENLFNFKKAFTWKKTFKWIQETIGKFEPYSFIDWLQNLKKNELSIIRELNQLKSWHHYLIKLDGEQKENFSALAKNLLKSKESYGPHEEGLNKLKASLPGHFISFEKIPDHVAPKPHQFDVAIIDESDLSGPYALMLFYLSKKVIIVGNRKWLTKSRSRAIQDSVKVVQEGIKDIKYNQHITLEDSFYDLCDIVISNKIKLKGHYRSRPEILKSFLLFTEDSEPYFNIKQFTPIQIEKNLEAVYCREGKIIDSNDTGKIFKFGDINHGEALKIIKQVKSIFENPKYNGLTIGIISLGGENQSHQIQMLLSNEFSEKELEAKKVLCVTPSSFQGLERDIILLTLVTSSLTKDINDSHDQGEDNYHNLYIALSRAKEKIILFHSIDKNDLNPFCQKTKILELFSSKDREEQDQNPSLPLDDLKKMNQDKKKIWYTPPRPFESWFEVTIFIILKERGYHVVPKLSFLEGVIDLTVIGYKNNLGINCFSKTNNEISLPPIPTQFIPHLTILRESTYTLFPEHLIEDLFSKLSQLDILPPKDWQDHTEKLKQLDVFEKEDMEISGGKPLQEEEAPLVSNDGDHSLKNNLEEPPPNKNEHFWDHIGLHN